MRRETEELIADIAASLPDGREDVDVHVDFRELFLGSDLGKRVLHDLLSFGHIYASAPRGDHAKTERWLGEREFAIKIIATISVRPTKPPQTRAGIDVPAPR